MNVKSKSEDHRVLIIRLSSLGDVAMTAPVVYSAVHKYPHIDFTILTRSKFRPIFDPIQRLNVHALDIDKHFKKVGDLPGFIRASQVGRYDTILDLHRVLRSKALSTLATLKRKEVFSLNKNRRERKQMVRGDRPVSKPLDSMVANYAAVFATAGYALDELNIDPSIYTSSSTSLPDNSSSEYAIGLAPFARYSEKSLPYEKIEELIRYLNVQNIIPYIFGGGAAEYQKAEKLVSKLKAINLIDQYELAQDISLISELDLMISMDSANMHLARLTQTPTITIWGGTHPALGFGGWGMEADDHFIVEPKSLSCQPCSVFGNKNCRRGDLACMHNLDMRKLSDKVINRLMHN